MKVGVEKPAQYPILLQALQEAGAKNGMFYQGGTEKTDCTMHAKESFVTRHSISYIMVSSRLTALLVIAWRPAMLYLCHLYFYTILGWVTVAYLIKKWVRTFHTRPQQSRQEEDRLQFRFIMPDLTIQYKLLFLANCAVVTPAAYFDVEILSSRRKLR